MTMTLPELSNALRILMNIDQAEFDTTLDHHDRDYFTARNKHWAMNQWKIFRDDPHKYFMTACDSQSEKLYAIIEARSKK